MNKICLRIPLRQWDSGTPIKLQLDGRAWEAGDPIALTVQGVESIFLEEGISGLTKLRGEFAILSHSIDQGELIALRDQMGIKPLYYAIAGDEFLLSSSIHWMIEQLKSEIKVDLDASYSYLNNIFIDQCETQLSPIKRVPPGCGLRFSGKRAEVFRYWTPESRDVIETSNYQLVVEELGRRLKRALLRRKRKSSGLFLSGGVDSSLLGFELQGILNSEERLYSSTLCFDQATANIEKDLSEIFERASWDTECLYPNKLDGYEKMKIDRDLLGGIIDPWPNFYMYRYMMSSFQEKEVQTVFSGFGGDDVFSTGFVIGDYLQRFEFINLFRLLKDGYSPYENHFEDVWRLGLRPVLGTLRDRFAKRWLSRKAAYYCRPKVFNSSGLALKFHQQMRDSKNPYADVSRRKLFYRLFVEGAYSHCFEQEQALAELYGLEMTYPYFDLELIDFSFALPVSMRMNKGYTKSILRDQLCKYVPKSVAYPEKAQVFDDVILEVMGSQTEEIRSLISSCPIEIKKWVKPNFLRSIMENPIGLENYDAILSILSVSERIRRFRNVRKKAISTSESKEDLRKAETL